MQQTTTNWKTLNQKITTCRACPRLVAWREKIAIEKRRAYKDWNYWGKPVPGFGDHNARVFIIGLAPGAHGSNRTGRMFTGDSSGDTLFGSLHRTGFANQPTAHNSNDGLTLNNAFITAIGRCAPPNNKPTRPELANCAPFLEEEWLLMPQVQIIVALGKMAFDGSCRLLKNQGYQLPTLKFSHGLHHSIQPKLPLSQKHLLASYHPSRQNTQTGRLTTTMLDQIFKQAHSLLT